VWINQEDIYIYPRVAKKQKKNKPRRRPDQDELRPNSVRQISLGLRCVGHAIYIYRMES